MVILFTDERAVSIAVCNFSAHSLQVKWSSVLFLYIFPDPDHVNNVIFIGVLVLDRDVLVMVTSLFLSRLRLNASIGVSVDDPKTKHMKAFGKTSRPTKRTMDPEECAQQL